MSDHRWDDVLEERPRAVVARTRRTGLSRCLRMRGVIGACALLAVLMQTGCDAAVRVTSTSPTTVWPADVEVSLCYMALARDGDHVAWQIESNSPNGVIELRTAPGDALVATATLDEAGSGSGAVPAVDFPATWLTAWIDVRGERGGCASVRYPTR
jgi:hypothetical protein